MENAEAGVVGFGRGPIEHRGIAASGAGSQGKVRQGDGGTVDYTTTPLPRITPPEFVAV